MEGTLLVLLLAQIECLYVLVESAIENSQVIGEAIDRAEARDDTRAFRAKPLGRDSKGYRYWTFGGRAGDDCWVYREQLPPPRPAKAAPDVKKAKGGKKGGKRKAEAEEEAEEQEPISAHEPPLGVLEFHVLTTTLPEVEDWAEGLRGRDQNDRDLKKAGRARSGPSSASSQPVFTPPSWPYVYCPPQAVSDLIPVLEEGESRRKRTLDKASGRGLARHPPPGHLVPCIGVRHQDLSPSLQIVAGDFHPRKRSSRLNARQSTYQEVPKRELTVGWGEKGRALSLVSNKNPSPAGAAVPMTWAAWMHSLQQPPMQGRPTSFLASPPCSQRRGPRRPVWSGSGS